MVSFFPPLHGVMDPLTIYDSPSGCSLDSILLAFAEVPLDYTCFALFRLQLLHARTLYGVMTSAHVAACSVFIRATSSYSVLGGGCHCVPLHHTPVLLEIYHLHPYWVRLRADVLRCPLVPTLRYSILGILKPATTISVPGAYLQPSARFSKLTIQFPAL